MASLAVSVSMIDLFAQSVELKVILRQIDLFNHHFALVLVVEFKIPC